MRLIIDRFEGTYAVCEKEDKTFINIERSKLPEDVKEGSVIIISNGKYKSDEDATEQIRNQVKDLMDELFK